MPEKPEEYDDYDDEYEEALNEIAPEEEQAEEEILPEDEGVELVPTSRKGSATSQRSGTSNGSGAAEEEEEPKFTFAGLEVVFWDEAIDDKYLCVVCNQVLRYPVQFEECGHRCCSSCLSDLLR